MEEKSLTQLHSRIRFLTYALIISGAINIALLATFSSFALKEKEKALFKDMQSVSFSQPAKELSNNQILQEISSRSFKELLYLLESKENIEEGYKIRDLALGCLTTFHYFNLEKALPGQTLEKREMAFISKNGTKETLTLFSGLSDFHYEAIKHYGYTEKWPLTSQGLFLEWKKATSPKDLTLKQAILLSSEYELIRNLFATCPYPVSQEDLLNLITEIRWEVIDSFSFEQKQIQDLSEQRRRSFLMTCLEEKSPIGASLLLNTDFAYVVKKLDDIQMQNLLDLVSSHPLTPKLCQELLVSSRSQELFKICASKLYALKNQVLMEPYDHMAALKYLGLLKEEKKGPPPKIKGGLAKTKKAIVNKNDPSLKNAINKKMVPQNAKKNVVKNTMIKTKVRLHEVKKGESLYQIAKLYKVDVEKLKMKNHLKGNEVKVGRKIEIP
jgi:LysM repeat protein